MADNPFDAIDARLGNIEDLLFEIKQSSKTAGNQSEADQLLTIQQAAEILRLTVATIYVKVHYGQIPVSKKGKRLYFSRQELMDWVKSGRRKTIAETAEEAEQYLNAKKKR